MNTPQKRIILASGSPRRLEILRTYGIEPEVVVPCVDEEALIAGLSNKLSPEELAEQLALSKAREVYARVAGEQEEGLLVIAADTLVIHGKDDILGKPQDRREAVWMLETLRNKTHRVITGVAVISCKTGEAGLANTAGAVISEISFADTTIVHFSDYSLEDIEEYLEKEPPFDKAGSYAIQGMWGAHVKTIEGDLENVIGLPYYRLMPWLS